jgi:hypothetical protein
MINALMGVAMGFCGHIAANEPLSGTIDAGAQACKTELAVMIETREGK